MTRERGGRFALEPVLHSALPDVAAFLHRWYANEQQNSRPQRPPSDTVDNIERRLRWLLAENPAADDSPLGYCVRDGGGQMRGLNLCFPSAFAAGDQRLLGLCSGTFLVEPEARSLGFFLFRKCLNIPGYSFHFASSCNQHSSALWQGVGGQAVPHSETEYILPLTFNVLVAAYIAYRTSNQAVARLARTCSRGANPILRLLTRPSTKFRIEPCQDWEKLAALAERHRDPCHITSYRSPSLLEWRYGSRSPTHPCGVYLFRDRAGNEGWFSLVHFARGGERAFRSTILLDAIWPRQHMNFTDVFQEILQVAVGVTDAISFRWQPGHDYHKYSRFMVRRNLGAPRAFVKVPKGAAHFPVESLDYDDSDFVAWTFPWRDA